MSKLLDLATTLEANSKAQAAATEQMLKHAFARHEQHISDALHASQQKINSAIHAHSQHMRRVIMKNALWLILSILTVIISMWGILWWQGTEIALKWREIASQNEQLEVLAKQGGKLTFLKCGGRLCLAIAKDSGSWERKSDQRQLFIPEGY